MLGERKGLVRRRPSRTYFQTSTMSVTIATRQGAGTDAGEMSSVYLSLVLSGGSEPMAWLIEV